MARSLGPVSQARRSTNQGCNQRFALHKEAPAFCKRFTTRVTCRDQMVRGFVTCPATRFRLKAPPFVRLGSGITGCLRPAQPLSGTIWAISRLSMTKLMRLVGTVSAVGILTCLARAAAGQSVLNDPVPLGVREGAGLIDQLPMERKAGFRPPTYQIVASPSLVSAQGMSIYGGMIGYVNRGALPIWPFQMRASVKNVDVGPTSHLRFGGDLKMTLWPRQNMVKASVRAALQKTVDVATRQDYIVALERVFMQSRNNTIAIGASGAYIVSDPTNGGSVHAGKLAIGSTLSFGATTQVNLDYSFKNDVEKQDDFSFTLAQTLTRGGLPA